MAALPSIIAVIRVSILIAGMLMSDEGFRTNLIYWVSIGVGLCSLPFSRYSRSHRHEFAVLNNSLRSDLAP